VDTPPPDVLDEQDLRAALAAHWGLGGDLRYLPKGVGAYHWSVTAAGRPAWFVTVDDLDTKPWIATGRDAVFAGLAAAYGVARALRDRAGLDLAVGPRPAGDGAVAVRLADRFSVAVHPFVPGVAGVWGAPPTPGGRVAVLLALADLHRATARLAVPVPGPPPDLPGRPGLVAALDEVGRPWSGGPRSEAARHALAARAAAVAARLAELDRLARVLGAGDDRPPVVTHGEPHPGNLIVTDHGLRLVDWDTVARTRPERDLWMLDDGTPDAFAPYEAATGTRVRAEAVRFHRLAWDLADIAGFTALFRGPHQDTAWTARKWEGFLALLAGAPSAPYG